MTLQQNFAVQIEKYLCNCVLRGFQKIQATFRQTVKKEVSVHLDIHFGEIYLFVCKSAENCLEFKLERLLGTPFFSALRRNSFCPLWDFLKQRL